MSMHNVQIKYIEVYLDVFISYSNEKIANRG